jgi:uncharacterized protein (DUF1684 family)
MNYKLLLTLMLLLPVTAFAEAEDAAVAQSHEEQIRDWRQRRDERLASDSGWMTLVGLEWLQEGENRVGSGASSTVKIPGGPALWGTIHVDGDELRFVPAPDSGVSVNGETATEVMLVADIAGEPTLISSGNLSFYVIFRESYALRIKDSLAPALQEFTGVKTYDFQPDWRYNARFVPAQEGQTIEIANVLGHFSLSPVYGVVEFERDGVDYRLLALGDEDSESLWFLFADRTSGRETYGAGRFLYSDGMPENGRLLVDFNKAYNPPCAFNEYSTCPLPPQQNRLDLAVTAGEKDYHSR